MSDKPHNPGAFPRPTGAVEGMTLRDYFAGQCLSHTVMDLARPDSGCPSEVIAERVAIFAYMCADAMLKERIK